MDYQVSARKYRPGTFDDVIGQPQVVQALTNAVSSKRLAHAFLFSGTRGVGKTTVARILAKALNCEQVAAGQPCGTCVSCTEIAQGTSVDVVEIDGASNTSVDDVREIRENAKFSPFRGTYRVYIIDEVHMLSNSAFNALLKILEEPPAHVVFIFATTELHKIPATILSRCQHYTFRRLARAEIVGRLEMVAAQDGIKVEGRSLVLLARASEGSMRDGLSLFDQAVALCGATISHEDLESLLGAVPQEHVHALFAAIRDQDGREAVRVVARVMDHGLDLRAYCGEVVEQIRNLLVASVVSKPDDLQGLVEASAEDLGQLYEMAKTFEPERLTELFKLFTQAEDSLRQSAHPRFALEIAAIRATRVRVADGPSAGAPAPREVTARPAGAIPAGVTVERRPMGSAPPTAAPPRSIPPARPTASQPVAAKPTTTPVPGGPPAAPASSQTSGRGTVAKPGESPRQSSQPPVRSGRPLPGPPPSPASKTSLPPTKASGGAPRPVAAPSPAPSSFAGAAVKEADDSAAPLALNWEACVAQVADAHPSIAPFLEMGQCLGIEGNEVTIGFAATATVARARMEAEDNLQAVRAVCEQLAGRRVRLRVVELSEGHQAGPTMAQIRAAKQQEEKMVLFERTRAHPLIRETLDAFGGDVVDVRRLGSEQEAQQP